MDFRQAHQWYRVIAIRFAKMSPLTVREALTEIARIPDEAEVKSPNWEIARVAGALLRQYPEQILALKARSASPHALGRAMLSEPEHVARMKELAELVNRAQ